MIDRGWCGLEILAAGEWRSVAMLCYASNGKEELEASIVMQAHFAESELSDDDAVQVVAKRRRLSSLAALRVRRKRAITRVRVS